MALAFWRDKRSTEKTRSTSSRARGEGGRAGGDATAALRTRARRRLIGAVALLLAAAILVPLLLDPAPRPVSDNIAIDIPSERQPFTPRLALPPVPDPGQAPLAPPPDLPAADAGKGSSGAAAEAPETAESRKEAAEAPKPAEESAKPALKSVAKPPEPRERTQEAKPARAEPKVAKSPEPRPAEPARAKGGKLLLQAAALGSEPAAQDLSDRLRKAGFAPFIEKIETPDGARYRVRVGPFSTRDEAQRAQARLRALGVSATLIST